MSEGASEGSHLIEFTTKRLATFGVILFGIIDFALKQIPIVGEYVQQSDNHNADEATLDVHH
jgi:hypothetical protein